jgi:jumonji domain-containing protein 7
MDPIVELLDSYRELNSPYIIELSEEPSPLEFMRHVALNTPFVIKGAVSQWRATRLWDSTYLRQALKDRDVNVAVTPKGSKDLPPSPLVTRVIAEAHQER